jgi:RNA exonuclease 1
MHSVLSTFFSGPISGEEKKKRITQRLNCTSSLSCDDFNHPILGLCTAESNKQKDPLQYMLSLEQMIENDYPVPSYMADVFQKPEGWVETPQPKQLTDEQMKNAQKQRVYAVDCEMVGHALSPFLSSSLDASSSV